MNDKLNSEAIIWKSEYNINNFKIDREHQKLFTLAREAMNISKLKDDEKVKSKLKDIITNLFNYTATHFANEQKHMEEIEYPELPNHKLLHKNMLNMLTTLISELNKLELEDIEKMLFNFIEEYFIRHIVLEDKKIQLWNTSLEDLKKNFGWKEIYSVGNVEIDKEHKKLFDIAQDAFTQVEETQRNAKIKEVLTELYTYMKTHFKHEEKFMNEINYPLVEEHKILHHNIIEKINTFIKQLPNMEESIFEKELAQIIDIALVHHIIQEDRKIIAWSKSNLQK